MSRIPFNKPYLSGKELYYIAQAVNSGKTSGNQNFTKKVHEFFSNHLGFSKSLLTTSCTDALEMAAILSNVQAGDEIILPSYTFVSTANAFVLRGAKLVFADCYPDNPNIDADKIEELITPKTKAIIVVHYAGVACDMKKIKQIATDHNVFLIEDAAQAIDSYYEHQRLGSFGDFAAFSFHETKNIICGEGGLLVINNESDHKRSEIIWEKGTNRSAFFRGEVDKYGWVDIGSSFLASDILAAFLYAQLENIAIIQSRRKHIWNLYYDLLNIESLKEHFTLPSLPPYASNNAHMFYLVCNNFEERSRLITHLKSNGIHAVFHYLSLHKSKFYIDIHDGRDLPNCDRFANNLVRLPLFYELLDEQVHKICDSINEFFK